VNDPYVGVLRRELRQFQTASVSLGVMAPTLAMSVTGGAAAATLGAAAPLAFVVAAVAVALVAYGFIRLAGEFAHAGSVYAFVGRTLHPRAGFLAGWALLGTYLVFPSVSIIGVAVFGRALLDVAGVRPGVDWYVLAMLGLVVIGILALRGIRPSARSVLTFEVISVLLIVALMVVIFVRVTLGSAPAGSAGGTVSDVVRLPAGVGADRLALAATAGFLAFAGFESAGSLGEESVDPRRSVPRALIIAVGVGAVFYVSCMIAQSLGFGTDARGVAAFRTSSAPLGELAQRYVGTWLAGLLDAGAVLSALGAGLGGVTVASRMLFALGRDAVAPRFLAQVSPGSGVPARAIAIEAGVAFVLLTSFRLAKIAPLNGFFYLATMGVLSLLVMYVLTNVAAAWHLSRTVAVEAIPPLFGIGVAGYALLRNVWPPAAAPYPALAALVAFWLVLGGGLASVVSARALGLAAPVSVPERAGTG
jgi:amino acid transporter